MYNIIYETSHQSRFDARYWMLGARDNPVGLYGEGGGRRVQDAEHVYTHGGCMLMLHRTKFQEILTGGTSARKYKWTMMNQQVIDIQQTMLFCP